MPYGVVLGCSGALLSGFILNLKIVTYIISDKIFKIKHSYF